jgi:FMN phosphatase YigB (HAD superfamily)
VIHIVLFDFGGVLSQEGWKQGMRAIADGHALNADQLIQTAADTVYETGYIAGKCTENDFWNALKSKTGITGDNASLTGELMSRFILDDRMMNLVKTLKSQNLIIGILSDQTAWMDKINARYDFFRHFDHVFNSYHIGKGKRDASLFDDVAGWLRTPPEKILFIDDDPGNVARARQRGWNAILYVGYESLYRDLEKLLCLRDSG